MSKSATQVYVLVGAFAGQSLAVNGHQFEEGKYTFRGNEEQVSVLTRIFSNYGAFPEGEQAEAEHQAYVAALQAQQEAAKQSPQQQPQAPASEQAKAAETGSTTANDAKVVEPAKPTLGEAIAQLDPAEDMHWTSNNLPSTDALEAITGGKVSRADVEAVASGYTRAKAKAARG
jgi:type II secretory pathway pseudopilin PulG